jgi:glucokinase
VRAGTGIGVGLVLGGEVFRGTTGADIAGEFGHMTIVAGGKACPCGNFGCWERYASAASAVELYTGEVAGQDARAL